MIWCYRCNCKVSTYFWRFYHWNKGVLKCTSFDHFNLFFNVEHIWLIVTQIDFYCIFYTVTFLNPTAIEKRRRNIHWNEESEREFVLVTGDFISPKFKNYFVSLEYHKL
jgi:hypothetical protein